MSFAFTSPLICAADLQSSLAHDASDWVLCDCRFDLANTEAGQQAWAAGHLPNAVYVHLDADLSAPKTGKNGRHPLPSRAAFAATLGKLGITPRSKVVAYDAQGGMFAARLWWMLRWLGHPRVAVLDGGLPAWQTQGGALDSALSTRNAVPAYPLDAEAHMATRDAASLLPVLHSNALTLIDARATDRFRGENETLDPIGGHIPSARNHFFKDNLAADGTFLAPDVLRSAFLDVLQGRAPESVVHQCGSGVTACHNLLAMQVAGLPSGALYPGSWSEWCAHPQHPVATGAVDAANA